MKNDYKSEGWVKLHRNLLEKPIWTCSTSNQKVVLITLLAMANHDSNEWEWKGKKFKCQSGQFITSLDSISKKANVSVDVVRKAIIRFEKYEFLTNESTKEGRLVTIVNWGLYQAPNVKQTIAKPKARPTNKNDKNNNIYMRNFEKFWSAYPKKRNKAKAQETFMKLAPNDELLETILQALKNQTLSEEWKKDNGQYIPYASTWLHNRRWEDEVIEVKAEKIIF